jgi:hypothetical protein
MWKIFKLKIQFNSFNLIWNCSLVKDFKKWTIIVSSNENFAKDSFISLFHKSVLMIKKKLDYKNLLATIKRGKKKHSQI